MVSAKMLAALAHPPKLTPAETEFCEALTLSRGGAELSKAFCKAFPERAAKMTHEGIKDAAKKLRKEPKIVAGVEAARNKLASDTCRRLRARGFDIPERFTKG